MLIPYVFLALVPSASPEGDLFATKVRPILAAHCFKCHGPDDKSRKAKLRLDVRDSALRVLSPGKPGESELVRRITSRDEKEMMPPPHAKVPLSSTEKQLLSKWIDHGAIYTEHWAFVAPRRPPLPQIRNPKSEIRNPIDSFIQARLASEGLSPSPPADRATLVRRVYLDLIGLPPTPEEADAFINDPAPDAYEKLVDRLLASPRYGERWARRWLDLARYADTNGFEKDRPRSIWPYRDWVINALNADKPFDQFTIEQLAGDLLPNATEDQRIATGFHRNTMLNEEGGIDPLEYRYYATIDRTNTTATVWLGLTLGCAECHTHKFDPIQHREYYRFMAFLNNADEPTLDVHKPEIAARRHELQSRIDAMLADLPKKIPQKVLEAKFAEWLKTERARTVPWTVLRPTEAKANVPHLAIQDDDSVFASGDQTKSDTYKLKFHVGEKGITALRLEVLPDDRLPQHGPGRIFYEGPFGDFVMSEFTVFAADKKVKIARATASFASAGSTIDKAIDGSPQTAWSINGGQGRAHYAIFQFAEPLPAGDFEVRMLFERYFVADLGRFRISATTATKPPDARDMDNDLEALLLRPDDQLSGAERDRLLRHFVETSPDFAKERAAIDAIKRRMPGYPTTLVMQERPAENPRPTFVHNRGEFLQPTERVQPGTLSILPAMHTDANHAPNRLDFARWLVSRENPLTARVTVNRQWAAIFGTGIVKTVHDFGYTGDPPSDRELLDWLAVEFMERGWSVKQLHRLIVTSATYRQSSNITDAKAKSLDPDNRLLSRGPRVRLDAEVIRDSVLQVSNLLSPKMMGPSVFPPQPASVTTEGTYGQVNWRPSPGEDRYRRGLYTFSKRTAPFAMSATFDGPSGETCLARRDVSNTPLQALTLLNDVVFTDAAQALGREFAANPASVDERIKLLFRRCLTRPPTDAEAAELRQFYELQLKEFASHPKDAEAAAGKGTESAVERAAWTLVARAMFNLDEMIVKE
jgi:hypothetical protein